MERIWSGLTGVGLLTILEFVLVVVALIVAPRNRRPSSALAWILLIALLPIIGILLFALIGSPKLPQHRRDKQQHMDVLIIERGSDLEDVSRTTTTPPWLPSVAQLNQTVGAMRLLGANDARLLTTFDDQLAALIAAVEDARRYLRVELRPSRPDCGVIAWTPLTRFWAAR